MLFLVKSIDALNWSCHIFDVAVFINAYHSTWGTFSDFMKWISTAACDDNIN